jgi:hypothetical protein
MSAAVPQTEARRLSHHDQPVLQSAAKLTARFQMVSVVEKLTLKKTTDESGSEKAEVAPRTSFVSIYCKTRRNSFTC